MNLNDDTSLDEELDTQDQPDDVAASETDDEELPDDPEALRTLLKEQRTTATRESKRLQREVERQTERAKEQATKADYWSRRAQETVTAPASTAAPVTAKSTAPAGDLETALAGLDMADFVADEKGAVKFVQALVERGIFATPTQAADMLDKRVAQERNSSSEETRAYQSLVQEYGDMADVNSDLSVESYAEFDRVAQEKPHWKQHEILAEATRRAARTLNITSGQQSPAPRTSADSRLRARTAQGGPTSRTAPPAAKAVVTSELVRIATKTAGHQLPPEVLARVAKRVAGMQKGRQG